MNYYDLTVGMFCEDSGREDLRFCYEAVREDFFNEISGEYLEATKPSQNNNSKKKRSIKSIIKENKKKIAAIAAIGVGLIALAVYCAKRGNKAISNKAKSAGEKYVKKSKDYGKKVAETEKNIKVNINVSVEMDKPLTLDDLDTEGLLDHQIEYIKRNLQYNKDLTDLLNEAKTTRVSYEKYTQKLHLPKNPVEKYGWTEKDRKQMNDKKYQDDFDRNEEKTITDRLDAYKKDLEDELKKDFPYDRRVRKLKSDIARDQIYLDNHKKERKMHKINPFTDEELGFKKTKS